MTKMNKVAPVVILLWSGALQAASWDCEIQQGAALDEGRLKILEPLTLDKANLFSLEGSTGEMSGAYSTKGFELDVVYRQDDFKVIAQSNEEGYPTIQVLELHQEPDAWFFSLYIANLSAQFVGKCEQRM